MTLKCYFKKKLKVIIVPLKENKIQRKRTKCLVYKKNITEDNNYKLYDIENQRIYYLENKLSKNKNLIKAYVQKSLINIKNKQTKKKKINQITISNKFNQNLEVIMNINIILLLKREILTGTNYSYYQSKKKR